MTESRNPFRELQRLLEQMQENFEQGGKWWESASGEDGGTASVRVDLEDRDA